MNLATNKYQRQSMNEWPAKNVFEKYEIIKQVGQGTYGKVYKARERNNPSKIVALKKIDEEKESMGFPMTALREIKYFRKIDHPNVVKLFEVATSNQPNKNKGVTYLVFEYLEHDLCGLLKKNIKFEEQQLKSLMFQLFTGLKAIHNHNIIHRDLKLDNILYSNNGVLKIGDFGLAKVKKKVMTNRVQALKHRAPEILFGSREYSEKVDIWSTAIMFAEMVLRKPLLQSDSEQILYDNLCKHLGSAQQEWPQVAKLQFYQNLHQEKHLNCSRSLISYLQKYKINEDIIDLLDHMLVYNPDKRFSAQDCLDHQYFKAYPKMADISEMPQFDDEHKSMVQVERPRKEMKKQQQQFIGQDGQVNNKNQKGGNRNFNYSKKISNQSNTYVPRRGKDNSKQLDLQKSNTMKNKTSKDYYSKNPNRKPYNNNQNNNPNQGNYNPQNNFHQQYNNNKTQYANQYQQQQDYNSHYTTNNYYKNNQNHIYNNSHIQNHQQVVLFQINNYSNNNNNNTGHAPNTPQGNLSHCGYENKNNNYESQHNFNHQNNNFNNNNNNNVQYAKNNLHSSTINNPQQQQLQNTGFCNSSNNNNTLRQAGPQQQTLNPTQGQHHQKQSYPQQQQQQQQQSHNKFQLQNNKQQIHPYQLEQHSNNINNPTFQQQKLNTRSFNSVEPQSPLFQEAAKDNNNNENTGISKYGGGGKESQFSYGNSHVSAQFSQVSQSMQSTAQNSEAQIPVNNNQTSILSQNHSQTHYKTNPQRRFSYEELECPPSNKKKKEQKYQEKQKKKQEEQKQLNQKIEENSHFNNSTSSTLDSTTNNTNNNKSEQRQQKEHQEENNENNNNTQQSHVPLHQQQQQQNQNSQVQQQLQHSDISFPSPLKRKLSSIISNDSGFNNNNSNNNNTNGNNNNNINFNLNTSDFILGDTIEKKIKINPQDLDLAFKNFQQNSSNNNSSNRFGFPPANNNNNGCNSQNIQFNFTSNCNSKSPMLFGHDQFGGGGENSEQYSHKFSHPHQNENQTNSLNFAFPFSLNRNNIPSEQQQQELEMNSIDNQQIFKQINLSNPNSNQP